MQDQGKIAALVLNYLFEKYTQDCGTTPYEIAGLIKQRNADPMEVVKYMEVHELIKNVMRIPGGEIHVEIAPNGLRKADTGFIDHNISKVVAALIQNRNQPVSLLDTTEISKTEFRMAFDLMEIMKIDGFYEIDQSLTRQDFTVSFNQRGLKQFLKGA